MRAISFTCLLAFASWAGPPTFDVEAADEKERETLAGYRCRTGAERVSDGGTHFYCPQHPGIDVTDALRLAEVVVRGTIAWTETLPPEKPNDEGRWDRATVRVKSVLKGNKVGLMVPFYFVSRVGGPDATPKPSRGMDGVWLLTRGKGARKELELISALDVQPAEAEPYLKSLLPALSCPADPQGVCPMEGWECRTRTSSCVCERPQHGGWKNPELENQPPSWSCEPLRCVNAVEGGACAKGATCKGRWWSCVKGRWKYHHISPPP